MRWADPGETLRQVRDRYPVPTRPVVIRQHGERVCSRT